MQDNRTIFHLKLSSILQNQYEKNQHLEQIGEQTAWKVNGETGLSSLLPQPSALLVPLPSPLVPNQWSQPHVGDVS